MSADAESGGDAQKRESADFDKEYKRRDLRYKQLTFRVACVSLGVSVLGFGVVTTALVQNARQSKYIVKSLRHNVQHSVVKIVTDLDKVYIDKPYLLPYFYWGVDIEENDPKYAEVVATAIMVLDVLDLVRSQSTIFREEWTNPDAWDEWVIDQFADSPILRKILEGRGNWYGPGLKELADKGAVRAKQNAARVPPS